MISANPDRMSYVDRDYIYREVNDAYLASIQCSREDILGRHIADIMGKESFEKTIKPHFDNCLAGERVRYQGWFDFGNLGRRFVDVIYNPSRDAQGHISGVLVTARDFTEAHLADLALQETRLRLDLVLSTIEDVVWITDWSEKKILFVNAAYERIWGRPVQELYENSESWLKAVHPDDRGKVRAALRSLGAGRNYDVEYRIVRPDGVHRWIHDRGCAVCDATSQSIRVAGVAQDITEQKKTEQVRRQLEQTMSHTQKLEAVGRLAAGMAHDFNSMLMVIRGNVDIIRSNLSGGRERNVRLLEEAIDRVSEAVGRGKTLLDKLLTYGRVRSPNLTSIDLNAIALDTVKLMKPLFGNEIRIDQHLQSDLEFCEGDASQLQQVVLNLVMNARDAMPNRGTLTIATENVEVSESDVTSHSGARPGRHVVLTVSDTGVGMDAKTQARLFEPFFSTKPVGQGTGLGLLIVYGVVRQAGGHVRVQSEIGKGTTFQVFLPTKPRR